MKRVDSLFVGELAFECCLASMERATASTRDNAPFVEQRRTSDHRAKTQRAPSTTNATHASQSDEKSRAGVASTTNNPPIQSLDAPVCSAAACASCEQPAQPSETTTTKSSEKKRKPQQRTYKQATQQRTQTHRENGRVVVQAHRAPSCVNKERERRKATNTTQCLSGLFLLWLLLDDRPTTTTTSAFANDDQRARAVRVVQRRLVNECAHKNDTVATAQLRETSAAPACGPRIKANGQRGMLAPSSSTA